MSTVHAHLWQHTMQTIVIGLCALLLIGAAPPPGNPQDLKPDGDVSDAEACHTSAAATLPQPVRPWS